MIWSSLCKKPFSGSNFVQKFGDFSKTASKQYQSDLSASATEAKKRRQKTETKNNKYKKFWPILKITKKVSPAGARPILARPVLPKKVSPMPLLARHYIPSVWFVCPYIHWYTILTLRSLLLSFRSSLLIMPRLTVCPFFVIVFPYAKLSGVTINSVFDPGTYCVLREWRMYNEIVQTPGRSGWRNASFSAATTSWPKILLRSFVLQGVNYR